MRLLIIRHAIAVARGTPDIADEDRPLTRKGERRFRQAARGLARIETRPDVLLTSPLPRARQTAEIAAAAWGGKIKPKKSDVLAGGSFTEIAGILDKLPRDATVAVVGHEPDVSDLLAAILGSKDTAAFAFKKGGVAAVEVAGPLGQGGSLLWAMPPRLLRRLGRR
jgi:phosphohistidine phosphatase